MIWCQPYLKLPPTYTAQKGHSKLPTLKFRSKDIFIANKFAPGHFPREVIRGRRNDTAR